MTAPTASNPPLTTPEIILIVFLTSSDRPFQFIAIEEPRVTAPRPISPIPNPLCVGDEKASTAPKASNPPPTIPVMVFTTVETFPLVLSQSSLAAATVIATPAAIQARPRGILVPEKVKIAPTPSKAPPTILEIFSSASSSSAPMGLFSNIAP